MTVKEQGMTHRLHPKQLTLTACVLALLLSPTRQSTAQDGIRPLPRDEKAFGLTLEEWAAASLQWWMSVPKSTNPRTDTTGVRNGIGQRPPVWFLIGAGETRTLFVPAGNAMLVTGPVGVMLDAPGGSTEESMRAALRTEVGEKLLDKVKTMEVSVDGVSLPNLQQYRVETPLFSIVLPPNNLFDIPVTAGKDPRIAMVAAGYFFLLPPLPVGKHVIQSRTEGFDPGTQKPYKGEETLTLIVQQPNERVQ